MDTKTMNSPVRLKPGDPDVHEFLGLLVPYALDTDDALPEGTGRLVVYLFPESAQPGPEWDEWWGTEAPTDQNAAEVAVTLRDVIEEDLRDTLAAEARDSYDPDPRED